MMQFSPQEHREAYFTWNKLSPLLLCKRHSCEHLLKKLCVTFQETVIFAQCNSHCVGLFETRFISNVFANHRFPHHGRPQKYFFNSAYFFWKTSG